MKYFCSWPRLSSLTFAVLVMNTSGQTEIAAQTNLTPVKTTDRSGSIVLSDQQATDLSELPRLSERQRLPLEIKERIRRFEVRRDAYVKEQAALRKQLNGAATDEERQRIRALIERQRIELLERAKTLREEVSKRLEVIRERMPAMSEVLDDARRTARDAAQTRKRRGQD
jgi:hypothetical protein